MSSVSKAFFYGVDGGESFEVQYNPKELKFDKPVSWKEHDDQGQAGALEFQKVTPATIQIELVFDTTKDASDVRSVWVNKLLSLTNPEASPGDGEAAELKKKRPPIVTMSDDRNLIWHHALVTRTVLDFFAGSGTTAQAIGEANNLDDLMDVPAGTTLVVPV